MSALRSTIGILTIRPIKEIIQWHFGVAACYLSQTGSGGDTCTFLARMSPELIHSVIELKITDMIVKDLKHVEELLLRVPFKSGRIGLPRSKSKILNNYRICDGKYLVKQVNATNKSTVQRFMLGKLKVSL